MYKLIVLIISSNNLTVYSKLKELSHKYYDLFSDQIKYFYIELQEDIHDEIIETGNHLYIKGRESLYPGIYEKTIKSIEYINKKYDFQFIMRTNISTFLHLPNILTYLDTVPKQKFASGLSWANGCITGTGIFFSKDVGKLLVCDKRSELNSDDVLISKVIRENNIFVFDLPHNIDSIKWLEYKNYYDENFTFDNNKTLYFRIRNDYNRDYIDIMYTKSLLKKIYNVDS